MKMNGVNMEQVQRKLREEHQHRAKKMKDNSWPVVLGAGNNEGGETTKMGRNKKKNEFSASLAVVLFPRRASSIGLPPGTPTRLKG